MKGDVRKRFSVKRLALLLCALGMALALFRSSKPVAAQQTFPSVPFGQLGQTGSWQLLMQDGFSSPLLGGSSYVRDAAGQMVQKPIWVTCAWHTYTALQSTPDEGCTHMRPIVDTDEDQIHLPRNVLPGRPVPWAADGLALQLRLVREDHTPSIGRYA